MAQKPFERRGWLKPAHSWTNHYFGRVVPDHPRWVSSLCGQSAQGTYENFTPEPYEPTIYPVCRTCKFAEAGVKRSRSPRRARRSLAPREVIDRPFHQRAEDQEYFCPKGLAEGTQDECTFMEEGNYTFHVDAWGNHTIGGEPIYSPRSISCNVHEGIVCYRSREEAESVTEDQYI